MNFPTEAQKVIDQSVYRIQTQKIVEYTLDQMEKVELSMSELQIVILVNHLEAMVTRAETGEEIMAIDANLFAEVSQRSLDLAKKIVEMIGKLVNDEHYLLSIHFETATQN